MPLKLISVESTEAGLIARYNLTHSTPGREGTTLEEPLTICIRPDKTWCELTIRECSAANPDEALERLALWLRRLADGIDKRSGALILPY